MAWDLSAALNPRSIAIVGASQDPNKIGGRPIDYLRRFGFRGVIHPVNPRRDEVQGLKTVPHLTDLDRAPDMAIVAVPGDDAVRTLDECGEMGVKVAVLMASGFGEMDPVDGKETERRMAERARARGMRIIGPNTQGIANFGTGAVASFSSMFLEVEPQDGPVGIVSQSGAMSVVPYGLLRERGIGVRHAHATGNDADVTVCELAASVAADPGVKLLLLYIESIRDPHHLAEAAAIARQRNVPVLALKSGRTSAGQSAAQSHTGALANEDRLVSAFLEQHGIWRVEDNAELVEAAELYLKGVKPTGRRVVVISNSGATCVMGADAAEARGLPLAELSEETKSGLRAVLPSFAATTNPIDITAALLSNSRLFGDILPILAKDKGADAVFVGIPVAGRAYDVEAFARDTASFAAETGMPIVVAAPQKLVADPFRARGLPVFTGELAAVRVLHQFVRHHEMMRRASERGLRGEERLPLTGEARFLDEAQSLARLAAAGIPVVPHVLCQSAEEAVDAAHRFGGPVAVKGCSAQIAHKTELGLVHLGLEGDEQVAYAFRACEGAIAAASAAFAGVIVAPMTKGRRELVLGAHRDPVFGPVVLVGDGGRYVEAMPDLRLLLPPFTREDVRDALGQLRIAPVLGGVRGEPPLALAPYLDATVAVGALMAEPGSRIDSIDVNPILVGARPEDCVALDAVVVERHV